MSSPVQAQRVMVNVTDWHGKPCQYIDVCAISLANAGQINELVDTQETDASGTCYFTIDEPCFFRPMLSPMLKVQLRVQLLGLGSGNILKHAVVDKGGFGTHTAIQDAIDYCEGLHAADATQDHFCIHVNPGVYYECLTFGAISDCDIILEGQGSVINLEDGTYNPVVWIRSGYSGQPYQDPAVWIKGGSRVTLRGLQISQEKSTSGYDCIGVENAGGAVFISDCLIDGNYGSALTVMTSTAPAVEVNNSVIRANNATNEPTIGNLNGTTCSFRFHNCRIYGLPIVIGDWGDLVFEHCHLIGNGTFGAGYLLTEQNLVISGRLVVRDCYIYVPTRATGGIYFGNVSGNISGPLIFTGNYIKGQAGKAGGDYGIVLVYEAGAVIVGNKIEGFQYGVDARTSVTGVVIQANSFEHCGTGVKDTDTAFDGTSSIGPNAFEDVTTEYDGVPDAALAQAHTLLDGDLHTDTVLGAVARGAMLVGNATPAWELVTIGAANTIWGSDGTDAAWRAQSFIDHGNLSGLGDNDHPQYSLTGHSHAHGDLTGVTSDQHHARQHAMDGGDDHSAGTPGDILYAAVSTGAWTRLGVGSNGDVLTLVSGLPTWQAPSGGSTHAILSATHTDSTPATVARGDLITGQGATATWSQLTLGAAGAVLWSDGTDAQWTINPRIAGYARIGSTSVPTNTTAGDLTVVRGLFGNTATAFVDGCALEVWQELTATAAGQRRPVFIRLTAAPAAASSADFRALAVVTQANSSYSISALTGMSFDCQFRGTGTVTNSYAISGNAIVLAWDDAVTIGTARGLSLALLSHTSGAATLTVGSLFGLEVTAGGTWGAGDAATNVYGLFVNNLAGTGRTNVFGIGVGGQSGSAGVNVGLYFAATCTTAVIWINTVVTGDAGGIVWGSSRDVNLYRGGTNILKTDDSFHAAASIQAATYARIGSLTAPTNTTAGDFTCERLFVGDAAAAAGIEALITGDMKVTGTLVVGTAPDYTVTNPPAADRAFDADDTTLDELADVVATIIADLITIGLFQ